MYLCVCICCGHACAIVVKEIEEDLTQTGIILSNPTVLSTVIDNLIKY